MKMLSNVDYFYRSVVMTLALTYVTKENVHLSLLKTRSLLIYCQRNDQQLFCFALFRAKLLLWFQLISFRPCLHFVGIIIKDISGLSDV